MFQVPNTLSSRLRLGGKVGVDVLIPPGWLTLGLEFGTTPHPSRLRLRTTNGDAPATFSDFFRLTPMTTFAELCDGLA
jgi:hypothetical protein